MLFSKAFAAAVAVKSSNPVPKPKGIPFNVKLQSTVPPVKCGGGDCGSGLAGETKPSGKIGFE